MAARRAGGYGTVVVATTSIRSPMSTTATSMPSTDVPLIRPAILMRRAASLTLQLPLQLVQQLQRIDGPQLVHFQIANALGDLIIHRLEQLDLGPARGPRRQLFGDRDLGPLVQRQNLSRAFDHRYGQSGQPRYLDAVAS